MDSLVTPSRTDADDRFDTARITAAVDALADKHAGREDVFRSALAQLLKAEMIAAREKQAAADIAHCQIDFVTAAAAQIGQRRSQSIGGFRRVHAER